MARAPQIQHIDYFGADRFSALGRNVVAHCVTPAALLFFLAALGLAGRPRSGDRIEHGSVWHRK